MFTVYRTRNLVNGRFYIGVHKTDNPDDNYLGSGKILEQAIAKYGRKNFSKDVLEVFLEPEPAFRLEERLVALEIDLPGCYNIRKGGEGGFDYILKNGLYPKTRVFSETTRAKLRKARQGKHPNKGGTWPKASRERKSEEIKAKGGHKGEKNPFFGKSQSEEFKKAASRCSKEYWTPERRTAKAKEMRKVRRARFWSSKVKC